MHALQVCVALVLSGAPADVPVGEGLGVLAVAPEPGPGPELVEMTLRLRERVAALHPATLDAEQLQERMREPLPAVSLAELDRAYEGARTAYVSGDHEGSVRALRTILQQLEALPESEEVFKRWTRTTLRLARSELNLGREEDARASIDRLLRAAPDAEVDLSLYPQSFALRVDAARAILAAAPRHHLSVEASAKGARVFVNGREDPCTTSVVGC